VLCHVSYYHYDAMTCRDFTFFFSSPIFVLISQNAPKDYASRRGLVAIVNKRRRLLNYLYKENPTVRKCAPFVLD